MFTYLIYKTSSHMKSRVGHLDALSCWSWCKIHLVGQNAVHLAIQALIIQYRSHGFWLQTREHANLHDCITNWSCFTSPVHKLSSSVLASQILFNLQASEGQSQIHTTLMDASEIHFRGGQISAVVFDAQLMLYMQCSTGSHCICFSSCMLVVLVNCNVCLSTGDLYWWHFWFIHSIIRFVIIYQISSLGHEGGRKP
jgi:hypothetical protein